MAMNDAFRFIERCKEDADFRYGLYGIESPEFFHDAMKERGFDASAAEIDDAFRNMKLKAADEEEASEIDELKQWYEALARPQSCAGSCSGCPGCA